MEKTQKTKIPIIMKRILSFLKVTSVHKDVSDWLLKINPALAREVREILDENKSERHLRGGMATKLKYLKEKEKTL